MRDGQCVPSQPSGLPSRWPLSLPSRQLRRPARTNELDHCRRPVFPDLLQGTIDRGRMSPLTAVCFTLLAVGLVRSGSARRLLAVALVLSGSARRPGAGLQLPALLSTAVVLISGGTSRGESATPRLCGAGKIPRPRGSISWRRSFQPHCARGKISAAMQRPVTTATLARFEEMAAPA